MVKDIKTKAVNRNEYKDYLKKAQGFFEGMVLNYSHNKYDATASNGIHCAILAADACLIYVNGYKCTSGRHLDVIPLIENLLLKDADKAARRLAKILEVKSLVEYTGDSYTVEEAHQIILQVERFFQWVKSVLLI